MNILLPASKNPLPGGRGGSKHVHPCCEPSSGGQFGDFEAHALQPSAIDWGLKVKAWVLRRTEVQGSGLKA